MSTTIEIQLRWEQEQERLNHFREHLDLHVFSPVFRKVTLEVLCESAKEEIRKMANAARKELGIPLEVYP